MARIRSIKPEFAHDELLGTLPREVRLLFVLLWPVADDEGRFRAHPALVKAECFPYDTDLSAETVDGWMRELARCDRLRLYEVEGQRYGWVVNFLKHQKISKPTMSRLPKPPGNPTESDASPGNPGIPGDSHPGLEGIGSGSGREGKGSDGRGSGGGGRTRTPKAAGGGPPPSAGERNGHRKPEDVAAERTLAGVLRTKRSHR